MTGPGPKTPAWIAEAMQWQRFVSSVQNDMRLGGNGRGGDPPTPASKTTLLFGANWLRAYKERRRLHPVGRLRR